VSQPCTVLIAAPEQLEALKSRTPVHGGELFAFSNADALRALEVITRRRPQLVALERLFAASSRGAALINRIKADPALAACEIRVVSLDPEEPRAPLRQEPPPDVVSPIAPDAPLDPAGTRSVPRFEVSGSVELLIDGNPATLVNLSVGGAQVLSPTVLKPNQRVRLTFSDDRGLVRVSGSVAWATFEIPPRYRAGIEFLEADAKAIDAFMQRHRS
jgi:hypothetical protein